MTRAPALPPPAERGATVVADRVVRRIAERAATEAALPHGRAEVTRGAVTVRGRRAEITVGVRLPYPAPLADTGAAVRDTVIGRVGHLTGLTVTRAAVQIRDLSADVDGRGRLRTADPVTSASDPHQPPHPADAAPRPDRLGSADPADSSRAGHAPATGPDTATAASDDNPPSKPPHPAYSASPREPRTADPVTSASDPHQPPHPADAAPRPDRLGSADPADSSRAADAASDTAAGGSNLEGPAT